MTNYPEINVSIHKDFGKDKVMLEVQPQQLGQVFFNILQNAFSSVFEKSKNNGGFNPKIEIKIRQQKHEIQVQVKDNGFGIAPESKNQLFVPLSATNIGAIRSLGILFNYDVITRIHRGKILIDSEKGKFTCIEIRLPFNNTSTKQ